jgi:hypothetical protein
MWSRSISARKNKSTSLPARIAWTGIKHGVRALPPLKQFERELKRRRKPAMPLGFAGTLFASQVRASTGKAGIAGIAAGLAFNMLLKRSPMGAMVLGGAFLARQAYKAGKVAQAKRDAKKALEQGAVAIPLAIAGPA